MGGYPQKGGALALLLVSCAGLAQAEMLSDFTLNSGLQFGSGDPALTAGITGQILSRNALSSVSAAGSASFVLNDTDVDMSSSVRLTATRQLKRGSLSAGFALSHAPVTFETVQDDLTLAYAEGARTLYQLFGGVSTELRATTGASLNFGYTHTAFDPVTAKQVPSDRYTASLRVTETLNPTLSVYGNLGASWYEAENAVNTQSLGLNASVGASYEINRRSSISGGLGASFNQITQSAGGATLEKWSTGLTAELDYKRDYTDGAMSLGFSQSVMPDAAGNIDLASTLRGGLTMAINADSNLGLSGSYSRRQPIEGGASTSLITFSPSYTIALGRDFKASASYALRKAQNADATHRFNLGVSRNFSGLN